MLAVATVVKGACSSIFRVDFLELIKDHLWCQVLGDCWQDGNVLADFKTSYSLSEIVVRGGAGSTYEEVNRLR